MISENDKEEMINQIRFLVLTISSECSKKDVVFDILPLLKLLKKLAGGKLNEIINNLLKDKYAYLEKSSWYFLVCQSLSLDREESTSLFEIE